MDVSFPESALRQSGDGAAMRRAEVWPLPLSAFEKYMFYDDRPEYPMAIDVFKTFRGALHRDAFEQAITYALSQHPLLQACVEEKGRRINWVPATQPPIIEWGPMHAPFTASAAAIDLRREPGIRVAVRKDEDRSIVHIRYHHACCDGKGTMQFLESLLFGYATACGESIEGPSVPYDSALLLDRNDWRKLNAPRLPGWRDKWRRLKDAAQFLWQAPRPLAMTTSTPRISAERPVFPGLATRTLNDEESRRLRAIAGEGRGTINDVSLAALFRALRRWDREHGKADGRARHRILMPHDLRIAGQDRLPATNVMSYGFITRRVADCGSPTFLTEIRDETQMIRRGRYALDFVEAMADLDRTGRLAGMVRKNRCLTTAVLTNMGDLTRRFRYRFPRHEGMCQAGNVLLESINGAIPIRPLTHVGACLSVYRGRYVLDLRCDPRFYTLTEAQRLCDLFAQELLPAVA